MAELNIRFKDGNELISLYDYSSYEPGCETCDYGSEYVNELDIDTTHYNIAVEFKRMYEYAISIGDAMKILAVDLTSFTEKEFVEYLEASIRRIAKEKDDESYDETCLQKLKVTEKKNEKVH